MNLTAAYPGTCHACDNPIVPGDPITIRHHHWLHRACAEKE